MGVRLRPYPKAQKGRQLLVPRRRGEGLLAYGCEDIHKVAQLGHEFICEAGARLEQAGAYTDSTLECRIRVRSAIAGYRRLSQAIARL